jgi:hypothetical protein
LENFNSEAYSAVKEIIAIKNPVACVLYGHYSVSVPNEFRDSFIESATTNAFQTHVEKAKCW